MIVREQPDGSLVMICQTDHAKLSGQLAAHWGNTQFDKPHQYSVGFRDVIVNGKPVLLNNAVTAERSGRILYGPAHQ